jgi:hypothetical protein
MDRDSGADVPPSTVRVIVPATYETVSLQTPLAPGVTVRVLPSVTTNVEP